MLYASGSDAAIRKQTVTRTKSCLPCLQLAAACLELEDDYRPPITFVVVQKRYNTRLYSTDQTVLDSRSGNIAPGEMIALQLKCLPLSLAAGALCVQRLMQWRFGLATGQPGGCRHNTCDILCIVFVASQHVGGAATYWG